MKTVVYKNIESKLLEDWKTLWEQSEFANYINSPQWFTSVIESFHYKKFAIVALYDSKNLISIAPLVMERKYGIDFYTNAPSDFVCGLPFLIDTANSKQIEEVAKQLLVLGNVSLSNVPEEFLRILQKYIREMDAITQSSNYYLPIKKDSNGAVQLNKRNKLIHQIKNIQEKFNLRSFDGTSFEGLDMAFIIDEQSSKHGKGYNTFNSSPIKEFYRTLAKQFGKYFLVNILYFENVPIAYEIGFLIDKNYFGSQMAYDLNYRHYSPGKVIFAKLADLLALKNVKIWDLGSGESPIKLLVTEEKRQLYQIIISQNKNIRKYCTTVGKLKNYAFGQSYRYAKLYSMYRKVKKIF